jgi:hypothetical protein
MLLMSHFQADKPEAMQAYCESEFAIYQANPAALGQTLIDEMNKNGCGAWVTIPQNSTLGRTRH